MMILMTLSLLIAACGSDKKEQAEGSIVESYLAVKDALVSTDGAKAQKAAKAFLKVNKNAALTPALEAMAATSDVAEQRAAFESLSMNMYNLVKSDGVDIPLYKQYCPMAFNNKGAFWLAAEQEVNNPYFGDRMLHCGSVQEVLNQ
ncbi:MAG: DUF3347 domain-containing protein [Roseivirga sp.]|nr:DUF3347 domain-containing protein [Roseivirga sp.]